jgi:hypothetical protein
VRDYTGITQTRGRRTPPELPEGRGVYRLDRQARTRGSRSLVDLIELIRRREVVLRALEEQLRSSRSAPKFAIFPPLLTARRRKYQ